MDRTDLLGCKLEDFADEVCAVDAAWPQSLTDMVDVVANALAEPVGDPAKAHRWATIAIMALGIWGGGRQCYLPTGEALRRAIRNERLYGDWSRGVKIEALAERYKLNPPNVYRILRHQLKLHRRKVQPDLFPAEE